MPNSHAWLTPESPAGPQRAVLLWVPAGDEWEQIARGALVPLIDPASYEKTGSLTPEETAATFELPLYLTMRWEPARMIGEIVLSAGIDTPDHWLVCDGASYSQAAYPDLFAVIGVAYGDPGGGNFNVPDLSGRAPIGVGAGPGLTARSLTDTGGAESHQLSIGEMPSHDHSVHTHGVPLVTGVEIAPVSTPNVLPGSTGSTGGDQPHNNMPPFLALRFLIYAG